MQPRYILHIIDSLGYGGAELLLKNSISLFPQYRHIVVFLHGPEQLKTEFPGDVLFFCFNYKNWPGFFSSRRKLRKIVKQYDPVLIHSHLQTSTLLARWAAPARIPLVSTVHSMFSMDAFSKSRTALFFEKLSVRKRHNLIAVSATVLEDYLQQVPFKGKTYVVYDFIPDQHFQNTKDPGKFSRVMKCVAVGNLKEVKNYSYLLKVFRNLKNTPITLDVYGEGSLKNELQEQVTKENLSIKLCGYAPGVYEKLNEYDLFIQASTHEGFGLSVIEAMAARVPIFISNIPVFREITNGYAHFFQLNDAGKAADQLKRLSNDRSLRHQYIDPAYNFARQNFSAENFASKLNQVYKEISDPANN